MEDGGTLVRGAAEDADMGGGGGRVEAAVGDTAEGVGCGGTGEGWAAASSDL